jgi:hypothetical protein
MTSFTENRDTRDPHRPEPRGPARELAAIRGFMDRSRRLVAGSWRHQVWWGLLTAVALLLTWWGVATARYELTRWIWPVALPVGWIGSVVLGRAEAAAPVRNPATRAFAGLWIGLGVTLSLVAVVGLYGGGLDPRALPGVLSIVLGGGYFATARITGIGWLGWIAVAWWVGGGVLLAFPGTWTLLALAAFAVLLEAVPGMALAREARTRGAARGEPGVHGLRGPGGGHGPTGDGVR